MASNRIQRQIDRLLDEADESAALQDWKTVRDRAHHALTFDPENREGQAFLSAAERALGAASDQARPAPQNQVTATNPRYPHLTAAEAERRQLTVMFCDLQGSTALSQQLDPEDLRDVIRGYQEVCADAVAGFGGYVAKYLGDGLLVYFGYPQAHEDDPQRAVRSGLAILQAMSALNERLLKENSLELAVRIGVHTGLVVAGEMGGGDAVEEMGIVGDTPNIAARLQEAAEPNSIVISIVTANLTQGFFLCKALGALDLKGVAEPMELYAVLSESGAQTRFDVAAAAQLTPLVGREQELGLLLDRWEQAEEGLGQVVLLSGEPGIGKSRLIEAVTERLATEPNTLRQLRCSAYHQNSALHPTLEYLEVWLGFAREDSAEERVDKLESALAKVDFPLAEAVTLLSGLLSIPVSDRFPLLAMSPEVQRERTLDLLAALLLDTPEGQPTFLVVEDLQWADPSTLVMIGRLLDRVPTANVMVLISYRPEFMPAWPSRAYVTPLMLNRLSRRLAGEMVERLTESKSLPEEIINQIASKSDGVPMFIEELTRMLLDSELLEEVGDHYELTGPLPPLAIPTTLMDSLTARLDRLGDNRQIVQMGAVLGREFTFELMQAVCPMPEGQLRKHLQNLVDAEFLYQRSTSMGSSYTFKHTLIRDAAYESLLRGRRQEYHLRAGQVLKERIPDVAEIEPEQLAYHYEEAGLPEEAVPYRIQAGERALSNNAYVESLVNFRTGLAAQQGKPMDGETAALLAGLGRSQIGVAERHEMNEAVENLILAFDYYVGAGDVHRAISVAQSQMPFLLSIKGKIQMLSRALELVDPDSHAAAIIVPNYARELGMQEAYYEGSTLAVNQGLATARREGDRALETKILANASHVDMFFLKFDDNMSRAKQAIDLAREVGGLDVEEEHARRYATMSLLILGDLSRGRQYAEEIQDVAQRLRQRTLLGWAYWLNAEVSLLEGDWQTARNRSDLALELMPRDIRILAQRAQIECEVGEFRHAEGYLDRLLEAKRLFLAGPNIEFSCPAALIPWMFRISGTIDRLDLAEEAAEAVLSSPAVLPYHGLSAVTGRGLIAAQLANSEDARNHYAAMKSHSGTMVSWLFLCADRILGLLAETMGDLDQASTHFEDALDFCRKAGYRPELAWTCCDYADMLRERDTEGDRAKAMSMLDESLAISRELGMGPLMERVLSRREILRA